MKKYFSFVLENYLKASKKISKDVDVYKTLVHYIPDELRKKVNSKFDIKGSMGQTNKSDCPWVAIFNPDITKTIQSGVYIVYVFKKDMTGFYLTLNQGIQNFKDLFNSKKYDYALKVANYFKDAIGTTSFSKEDINLGNVKPNERPYGYQKTNILSKYYSLDNFDDNILFADLFELISIYDEISKLFETSDYNDLIKKIISENQSIIMDGESAIKEIQRYIDPDSEIPFGFRKQLVEQIPYVDRTNKYTLITSPKLGKIDYVKKTIRDLKVGLHGEALVVEYEKEKLVSFGREDLAEKVRWVSKESDQYGYDIESFDIDSNGIEYSIKIEVKTTTSQIDTEFYISKKEVEASLKYKNKYCLYRLYDAKSQKPKFYRVYGAITENFYLDPVSYMARYKFVKINNL